MILKKKELDERVAVVNDIINTLEISYSVTAKEVNKRTQLQNLSNVLMNLPVQNLYDIQAVVGNIAIYARELKDVLKFLTDEGYTVFKPYVLKYKYNKNVLVLGITKVVSLNRYGYFQVTSAMDGGAIQNNSHAVLKELKEYVDRYKEYDCKLFQRVFYMNLLSMLCSDCDFQRMISTNEGIHTLNGFVRREAELFGFNNYEVRYKDVIDSIETSSISITPEHGGICQLYRVKETDLLDYCRVMITSKNEVTVEVVDSFLCSKSYRLDMECIYGELDTVDKVDLSKLKLDKLFRDTFVSYLLNVVGLHIDANSIQKLNYVNESYTPVPRLNMSNIIELNNIGDIK